MGEVQREERDKAERLVGAGAEILGGLAGAAIGAVVAGPGGALAGGAGGPLATHGLRYVGEAAVEFARRRLGRREEVRVGGTLGFAALKIQEHLAHGRQLRQDGFFDPGFDERAAAGEVFETVLLVAQREPQEKKLSYLGNLLANVAFDPHIDRTQAHQLIRLAERLSYRQLCLLEILRRKGDFGITRDATIGAAQGRGEEPSEARQAVMQELFDMCTQGVVQSYASLPNTPRDINLPDTFLLYGGKQLHRLMELESIGVPDLEGVAALLRSA